VVVLLVVGVETTGGIDKVSAVISIDGLYNRVSVLLTSDVSILGPRGRLADVFGEICLGDVYRRGIGLCGIGLCGGRGRESRRDRVCRIGSDSLRDGEGL